MSETKSPLTTLVELMLFAPLGAALLLREQLPKFAVTGRERLESRVRVAKMVGEFAVKTGKQELERRLAGRTAPSAPASASTQASAAAAESVSQSPAAGVAEAAEAAPASTTATGRPHLEMNEPPVVAADLAIPGYDSLAASQVVERLGSLAPSELDAVRRYELAGRHRRTILNRIDQLVA